MRLWNKLQPKNVNNGKNSKFQSEKLTINVNKNSIHVVFRFAFLPLFIITYVP